MCMTLILTFRMGSMSYKYANRKAMCNFLFVGNTDVCHICHRLRDINGRNVHNHDLNVWNWPRSNVNMLVWMPHATFYALAIAMFVPSVTVCEIITFTSHCTRFKSLTLQMKVKDVDDLYENWQTTEFCQHARVLKKWRLYVQLFVRSVHIRTVREGRTDVWTNERTTCLQTPLCENGID